MEFPHFAISYLESLKFEFWWAMEREIAAFGVMNRYNRGGGGGSNLYFLVGEEGGGVLTRKWEKDGPISGLGNGLNAGEGGGMDVGARDVLG